MVNEGGHQPQQPHCDGEIGLVVGLDGGVSRPPRGVVGPVLDVGGKELYYEGTHPLLQEVPKLGVLVERSYYNFRNFLLFLVKETSGIFFGPKYKKKLGQNIKQKIWAKK